MDIKAISTIMTFILSPTALSYLYGWYIAHNLPYWFRQNAESLSTIDDSWKMYSPWMENTKVEQLITDSLTKLGKPATNGMIVISTPMGFGKTQRVKKVVASDKSVSGLFSGIVYHDFSKHHYEPESPLYIQILSGMGITMNGPSTQWMPTLHHVVPRDMTVGNRPVLVILDQVEKIAEEHLVDLKRQVADMAVQSVNDPNRVVYLTLSSEPVWSQYLLDANGGLKVSSPPIDIEDLKPTAEQVEKFIEDHALAENKTVEGSLVSQIKTACQDIGLDACREAFNAVEKHGINGAADIINEARNEITRFNSAMELCKRWRQRKSNSITLAKFLETHTPAP